MSIISLEEGLENLKAAAQIQDDRAVEQAFAEQVYTRISNRCGPLMKAPHPIGFEIVFSNEDNTQILGIWAFRLSPTDRSKLLYVPCFFNNGKVTAESIYDVSRKQFRPLTPEWCQHMLDSSGMSDGTPQARSDTMKLRPQMHLDRILNSGYKMSSALAEVRDVEAFESDLQTMFGQTEVERLLPGLARRVGGTKMSAILMTAAERSAPFAQAIAGVVDEWGDVFTAPDTTKQASGDAPLLELVVGAKAGHHFLKQASGEQRTKVAAALNSKGYWFEGYKTGDKPDYTTVTYDASSDKNSYVEVVASGQHRIVLQDGTDTEAVIGLPLDIYDLTASDRGLEDIGRIIQQGHSGCVGYAPSSSPTATKVRHAAAPEKKSWYRGGNALWCRNMSRDDKPKELKPASSMQSGKYYALYNAELGCLTSPSKVLSVESKKGCKHINFEYGYSLLINPTSSSVAGYGTIDDSWKAIEVDNEAPKQEGLCCPGGSDLKPLFPGNAASVNQMLFEGIPGMKRASVAHEQECFTVTVAGHAALPCDRLNAMIKLAGVLAMEPDAAEELLDRAIQDDHAEVWLAPANEKLAGAMMRIVDSPRWESTTDPVLQVRREEPQSFVLRTERQQIHTPASRIGDRYIIDNNGKNSSGDEGDAGRAGKTKDDEDEIPDDILLRGSPDQVAQFAEGRQGKMLDHAIIGSMAQAGDVGLYLDEYIPKLEDGLDHIGRCLFLFRWKPQEWRKLYGADDMLEVEDRLSSTFRMMGEMVLQLIRKAALNQMSARSA